MAKPGKTVAKGEPRSSSMAMRWNTPIPAAPRANGPRPRGHVASGDRVAAGVGAGCDGGAVDVAPPARPSCRSEVGAALRPSERACDP